MWIRPNLDASPYNCADSKMPIPTSHILYNSIYMKWHSHRNRQQIPSCQGLGTWLGATGHILMTETLWVVMVSVRRPGWVAALQFCRVLLL